MSVLDVVLVTLIVLGAVVFVGRRFVGKRPERPSKAVVGGKLAKALENPERK